MSEHRSEAEERSSNETARLRQQVAAEGGPL
jgi:hypothetical protein